MNNELTAALATIEKCREITNCPDGVDLQDHLRQLAAENVGLKDAISAVNRTAEECELNGDELKYVVEPSEFEALTDLLDETPTTDAYLAGIKAEGAEACVRALVTSCDDDFTDAPNICAMVAFQLREGAK
ncbi:hypothetical protein SB6411_00245 [Klebsiella spallanzanii]|uniref:Uncharacterized protein n=1 Tax=Klebsiella spallanzanii TaxID=2587528 RepID=A0ABY6V6Z9_9ENTR|nr:hypothetical protein [Klebsiella spallanzanii]VUS22836.1 hypothetical protein SB6411_00245 [Klebsiella spallanzanii]